MMCVVMGGLRESLPCAETVQNANFLFEPKKSFTCNIFAKNHEPTEPNEPKQPTAPRIPTLPNFACNKYQKV